MIQKSAVWGRANQGKQTEEYFPIIQSVTRTTVQIKVSIADFTTTWKTMLHANKLAIGLYSIPPALRINSVDKMSPRNINPNKDSKIFLKRTTSLAII